MDDHDDGEKTILARTARFDGESLADRICWRSLRSCGPTCLAALQTLSKGEGVLADASASRLNSPTASGRDGLHVGPKCGDDPPVRPSSSPLGTHTPVSRPGQLRLRISAGFWSSLRSPPSTLLLAEWTGGLARNSSSRPNVGGWLGGRAWLSGRSVTSAGQFRDGTGARI